MSFLAAWIKRLKFGNVVKNSARDLLISQFNRNKATIFIYTNIYIYNNQYIFKYANHINYTQTHTVSAPPLPDASMQNTLCNYKII